MQAPPGRRAPRSTSGRPLVDPRLHQRWVATRREEGRRRLRVLTAVGGVMAVGLLLVGVVESPVLRVRHVQVFGVTQAGLPAVSGAAGLEHERLMIDIHPSRLERAVESIPWVASARVVVQWPGTVRIAVTHRFAIGEVLRSPGHPSAGTALVDSTGRVLADRPGTAGDLPVLELPGVPGPPGTWIPGLSGSPGSLSSGATARGATAAGQILAVASALPASVKTRVSSVSVRDGGVQMMIGTTTVLLGSTSDLAQKMTSLATVVGEVDLTAAGQLDLRVPDRPTVTSQRRP